MPDSLPLFVRISATDWEPGGWDVDHSVILSRRLKELGVDLIDVSSAHSSPKLAFPSPRDIRCRSRARSATRRAS